MILFTLSSALPAAEPMMRRPFALGLATLIVDQPYRDLPKRITPIPLITYRGLHWVVEGPRISYMLNPWKTIKPALSLRYRFTGYDPDKSDFMRGMKKR